MLAHIDWTTCEDFIEGIFNIGRVQRWCLHKHEAFLFWFGPFGESKEGREHNKQTFSRSKMYNTVR